jgi:transcriptional regulator with XRE-family HTH domain
MKTETLGYQIRKFRKEKGLSQNELLEKAGIDTLTKSDVSRYENDRITPSEITLNKLCEALQVEFKIILEPISQ